MTGTHVRTQPDGIDASPSVLLRESRVVQGAVAMILVQLAFRAWATYGSWFLGDDLAMISRMADRGGAPGAAFEAYGGHLMPAGMYATWLLDGIAPFDYRFEATVLLVLQALASVGMLRLLVSMFGVRPGILPPLALYLFPVISLPAGLWWAAGINQLPMQVALVWGLAAHLGYLRTGRRRDAFTAAIWVVAGLLFYEKTLLVLGAYAILALGWFARGSLLVRVRHVLVRYRTGVLLDGVLAVAYLLVYVGHGLNFSPHDAGEGSVPEVVTNMVAHAYLPGMLGGPLLWQHDGSWALPDPGLLLMTASIVAWVVVLRTVFRHRRRAKRALWLPAFFLVSDVLLVAAGRASIVGPVISLDLRYQSELPAVTAVALGLALLPLRGATETVEKVGTHRLLDHRETVTAVIVAVSALSLVSSTQYALHWQQSNRVQTYVESVVRGLESPAGQLPIIDDTVPSFVMLGFGYPINRQSHVFHAFSPEVSFVDLATDHLAMIDKRGRIEPALVPVTRHARRGPHGQCGYRVQSRTVSVPLNGPVAYGGWWVRIGYLASDGSLVRVSAGDATYSTTVEPGVHALYFRGGGSFDHVRISGLGENVTLCTNDVTVGRPVPRTEFKP